MEIPNNRHTNLYATPSGCYEKIQKQVSHGRAVGRIGKGRNVETGVASKPHIASKTIRRTPWSRPTKISVLLLLKEDLKPQDKAAPRPSQGASVIRIGACATYGNCESNSPEIEAGTNAVNC